MINIQRYLRMEPLFALQYKNNWRGSSNRYMDQVLAASVTNCVIINVF